MSARIILGNGDVVRKTKTQTRSPRHKCAPVEVVEKAEEIESELDEALLFVVW